MERTWASTVREVGALGGFRAYEIHDLIYVFLNVGITTLKNNMPHF